MKLSKYPKYKDSNLDWLGEIPGHWEVRRNKSVFYEASKLSKTGAETLLTVSHITGVTPRSEKNVNMFFAETMEGYKICQEGDLIINTMWAWMGALGTSRYYGICSPAYNVYRSIKGVDYDARYFDYLFKIPEFVVEMTKYSKGIVESRLRLYPKDFFRINTPLPPKAEQTAIANYLDATTQALDKKVSLLEQKIKYYEELKKAIINETVTKGLDKNVALKDSGVDYIGQIPKHWEVKRVKETDSIIMGQSPSSDDYNYEFAGLPFLQGNAEFGKISPSPSIWCKVASKIAKEKDIMVSVRAPIGAVNIANQKYGIGRGLCAIRAKRSYFKFLYYYFIAHNSDLNSLGTGTTYIAISLGDLTNLFFAFPPISEQIAIADYLDTQTNQIDLIVQNLQQQIEKQKELRKSLINEVVTGKVKVY